jgi:pyruvate/2-oxoglutarate dehydrogenase complex dihydrolipoamide dehydrogenase (E3) component
MTYDVAVVGAGSAGLVAALTANRRGARVAMIEKNKIGGECTHSGCVPSKTLIHVAKTFQAAKDGPSLGLPEVQGLDTFDFGQVMEHVDSVVQGIYAHEQPQVFRDAGIDVFLDGSGAQFLNDREIRVGDEVIEAEHTVICTGSSPRVLPTLGPGQPEILTNETFWELREQPNALMFLGGGVIAAELGQVMARFGTEVMIVDRNPRILKVLDPEVQDVVIEVLEQDGVHIINNANCASCGVGARGVNTVTVDQHGETRTLETRGVLFASMGRVPNVQGLQLENAGVEYDERHGIHTNDYLQTTAPHIYACGDVATRAKFTHTASYQAEICVDNILEGNHRANDLSVLPWAIYMEPEVAHVGMSEAQAREKHGNVQTFRTPCGSVDRFITESATRGFLKVVMDEEDNILGADAVGAHAGEWVQFITLAMRHDLPITAFAETIFAYPTFSEIAKKVFTRFLRTKL